MAVHLVCVCVCVWGGGGGGGAVFLSLGDRGREESCYLS